LALALVGEGDDGAALKAAGLEPIELEAKEGLAFVNGTQAQAGLAALLVHDAWVLWRTAHGAAAMSLEAVRGTPEPFDARIRAAHRADREPGPLRGASRVPGARAGVGVGVHDVADRRRGARGRMPGAGHARERAIGADGRQPGRRRAHGDDRRLESGARARERGARRGDRAARGG